MEKIEQRKFQRGFTLIEILAVVVILGIISSIGVVSFLNIRKNQIKKFDQTQIDIFNQVAKTYFSDHKTELPVKNGDSNVVYLKDLVDTNYIDSLLDYNKNSYKLEESYTRVVRLNNKYFYVPLLVKEGQKGESIVVEKNDKSKTQIVFNNYRKKGSSEINCKLTNATNKTKCSSDDSNVSLYYVNKTPSVDVNIEDKDGLAIYQYFIYKNNKKLKESEYIDISGTNQKDTLSLDITDYEDGIYKLYVEVYDVNGFNVAKYSKDIIIDTMAPVCAVTKEPNVEWTNKETTVTGTCKDNKGVMNSGCQKSTVNKIIKKTNYNKETTPDKVADMAGNETQCGTIPVRIDVDKPNCDVAGANSTWTNQTVKLTATCKDTGGSGCTKSTDTVSYENAKTVKNPFTFKDNAGNEASCGGEVPVYVDKIKPSCTSSGGSPNWTAGSRTLTGTCKDTGSGCKNNASLTINESKNATLSPGTVWDNAGNYIDCPTDQIVRIDKEPPSCTSSGGTASWVNTDVTITGNCSDSLSGCQKNVSKYYNTDTYITAISPGIVYDNVGNSTICPNQSVYIDKTKPTCKFTNKSNHEDGVDYTLSCSDPWGSGVSKCGGDAGVTSKNFTNKKQDQDRVVYDAAGNKGTCSLTVTHKYKKRTWNSCKTTKNTCQYGCDSTTSHGAKWCNKKGGSFSQVAGSSNSTGTCVYNCSNCHTGSPNVCVGGWNSWGGVIDSCSSSSTVDCKNWYVAG